MRLAGALLTAALLSVTQAAIPVTALPDAALPNAALPGAASAPTLQVVPLPELRFNFSLCDTVRLLFIGDVMQHGKQVKAALAAGNPAMPEEPASYNYETAFKYIGKQIRRADIAVANMEFPVGDYPYGFYPNFKAPISIAQEAAKCGINLFLVANNHIADMGGVGMEKTLSIYDTLNVDYIGAYHSAREREEREPLIIGRRGIKVAMINFCYGLNRAAEGRGVVNTMDSALVCRFVERAVQRGADLVVALPHWGEEYKYLPNSKQRSWAKMLFERGVRLIVGTHPHVPQLAEILPDVDGRISRAVFYSLGNYISNQSVPDLTQLELMVEVALCRNRLTGEFFILEPVVTPLWCFKAGEYEENYTVVPVSEVLASPERVRKRGELERVKRAFKEFLEMNLIRRVHE